MTWQAQGSNSEAVTIVERALSLGEPEGFCRVFLDEGEPMAALLWQAQRQSLYPGYVDKLLAAFPASGSDQAITRARDLGLLT